MEERREFKVHVVLGWLTVTLHEELVSPVIALDNGEDNYLWELWARNFVTRFVFDNGDFDNCARKHTKTWTGNLKLWRSVSL